MNIAIESGVLYVEDWSTDDQDVVRFFEALGANESEAPDRLYAEYFSRAVKVGAIALRRAQTQTDVDAVRREFDALKRDFDSSLDELAAMFDPDNRASAVGLIQDILDEHFAEDGSKFIRLLDYTWPDSPIHRFHEAIKVHIDDLERRLIAAGVLTAEETGAAAERERSPLKGEEFEYLLAGILSECTAPFRDRVRHVGREISKGGSRKGDILIHMNSADAFGREPIILVEAKREANKPTGGKGGILQEMSEAMAERNADFAIAVFSDDAVPAEVGLLRPYSNNRLICAIPADGSSTLALELAYYTARAELCYRLGRIGQEVDEMRVRQSINLALEKLRQFRGLKQNATSLINTAGEIRDRLDEIERDIRTALEDVISELRVLDEEASAELPEGD